MNEQRTAGGTSWRNIQQRDSIKPDLDEDAVEHASREIWQNYPIGLPAWEDIPELSLTPVSRADFRRMARAAIRTYLVKRK